MTTKLKIILIAVAVASSGCNRNRDAVPTGQVVATVDGQEITLEELHAETGPISPDIDAATRKAVEQAALQQIVGRTIVANAAREQKLDQTPFAAIMKRRAEQEALVNLMQRKLTSDVPAPSREEVELYIRDHPSSFAQRRVFVVDQIIANDVPPAVAKALENYTSFAEVQQAFAKAGVKSTQTVGTIDALAVDPDAAEKLATLQRGTMFISPEGAITRINLVRDVVVSPIPNEDATRLAREAIQNSRASALTQRQMAGLVARGMADVRYNQAYRPLKPEGGARAAAR